MEQDWADRVCNTGPERREERKENRRGEAGEYRIEKRRTHTDIKNKGKF